MKKLMLLTAGLLFMTGTAMANCGTCEADVKKAKDKAECDMEAAKKTVAEKMEHPAKRMEHPGKMMEKHEHPKKALEASKDKASEQAQQKRKKWWKFWGGNETAE
jgi:hypothetical protein